jgi:hypothetical protein
MADKRFTHNENLLLDFLIEKTDSGELLWKKYGENDEDAFSIPLFMAMGNGRTFDLTFNMIAGGNIAHDVREYVLNVARGKNAFSIKGGRGGFFRFSKIKELYEKVAEIAVDEYGKKQRARFIKEQKKREKLIRDIGL